ncbi:MAG TPA: penicillin-binding protein 2 [Casimicrobiaceae bacterium]|nr:penicillin-binding protein 2 [Casimicrobiaceae bacterium]
MSIGRLLFTSKRGGFSRGASLGASELRNPERELFLFRRRLSLVAFLVFVAFCGLFGRFFYLQVVQHAHFETLAETNRIAIVPIVPNRGVITDRNGVVLAQSYSAYTLEITPSRVKDLDETIDQLTEFVDIQPRDRKRFRKQLEEAKNFESLPIRTRLTDDEVARFAVNRYRFPGVDIKARLFRNYPFGEVASHVVGYISRINDKDNERIAGWEETANYKGSDYIGKVGIELSYERELHGTTGVEDVEVDSGGRAVRTLKRQPPIAGNNLTLSLDIELQKTAETAFGDRRGALVAIDPTSGDVLAFVSKPGFDPNLFVDGIDAANWQELNESPDKPLLNRPLRGAYPPGSTIKPFLALGALNSGRRTPGQAIHDPGFFQIPGQAHRFRDDKPGGHGMVDMYKSIVVSCDTYYYMLANDTDIDDTARFLSTLGFGQKTGIDIEGELTGVLPSREWKRQRFAGKNFRDEHRKWYLGDSISAGIGQGYNAFTPIQLAHAIAMIAADGVGFTPHLVKTVQNVKTGEVRDIARDPASRLTVKPEHLAIIRNALVGVNKEGTSAAAFKGAQYVSGGKTGTAQVFSLKGEKYSEHHIDERLRDHAWFMAYAPSDHPKIALAVLVENGGFGAQAAAPIARKVIDRYLLGSTEPGAAQVVAPGGDDESD